MTSTIDSPLSSYSTRRSCDGAIASGDVADSVDALVGSGGPEWPKKSSRATPMPTTPAMVPTARSKNRAE